MTTAVNYESQRAEREVSQAMIRHDFSGPIVVIADGESRSRARLRESLRNRAVPA